jgi:hypothetical protein
LRASDQRYGLTGGLAELVPDSREEERVRHSVLALFRQRLYQIIAGYEDANDADRLRHDPAFQILAEHTAAGTNLRFLVTNLPGRSRSVFSFYNDRGECENRMEEFKNGFAADRLSCHRFRANAFRLLLHSFAYNLVNLFRLQLPAAMRSAQIETLRTQLFKIGARIRQTARCIRIHLASGWPFQDLFQAASLCDSS